LLCNFVRILPASCIHFSTALDRRPAKLRDPDRFLGLEILAGGVDVVEQVLGRGPVRVEMEVVDVAILGQTQFERFAKTLAANLKFGAVRNRSNRLGGIHWTLAENGVLRDYDRVGCQSSAQERQAQQDDHSPRKHVL
jgi:hypothetical protein